MIKILITAQAKHALDRCATGPMAPARRTSRGYVVELDDEVFTKLSALSVQFDKTLSETILMLAEFKLHNPFGPH